MKPSFLSVLVCTSMLVFVIGCGKDNKSGGGAAAPYNLGVVNSIIYPGANINQNAFANLKAWYENPAEANVYPMGSLGSFTKETKTLQSGISFQGSVSLCIGNWGINCGNQNPSPTDCFQRSTDGVNYHLGTPSGQSCVITQHNITKHTNNELANAVNGAGIALIDVIQQGNVFYVIYGTINGYQQNIQMVYTINTDYHSLLNPVTIENRVNGTVTINKNLKILAY